MRRQLVPFALLLCMPTAATAQEALPDGGYAKAYTIQAEAAWLGDGRVLSPAFVRIERGQIRWVRATAPKEKKGGLLGMGASKPSKPIVVGGTLAPGLVDAWSSLYPSSESDTRKPSAVMDIRDGLPADFAYEDSELSGRIAAARQSGIAAAYVGRFSSNRLRGYGTPVVFSAHDLPLVAGRPAYEIVAGSMHSSQNQSVLTVDQIRQSFLDAQAWRDSWDEYDEKLEKYDKDVEAYPEKVEKWAKERDEYKAKIEKGDTKDDKGKDLKEPAQPKYPKRPKKPGRDRELKPLLDAIDGKLQIRFEAHTVDEIQVILELIETYELDAVIVGAYQADIIAKQIADADVPVLLGSRPAYDSPDESRDFGPRYIRLTNAGVKVAITSQGNRSSQAAMLYHAGQAIASGANADDVWASLTTIPAQILGLDDAFGRIGQGASASMLRFEGASPFDASAAVRAHKPR